MRALVEDPDAWTRRRLVDRSYERELGDSRLTGSRPADLLADRVGEMWLRGPAAAGPFPHLVLDPSTIPPAARSPSLDRRRATAHVVPYRLDVDVARRGRPPRVQPGVVARPAPVARRRDHAVA